MSTPSRLEKARRQVRLARYSIGAVAVAGFGLFAFAARAAHPATRSSSVSTSSSVATDQSAQSFDFGGSSIGPSSGSAPSVQSAGS